MSYRDPQTGHFITKEHWYEIQREEQVNDPDERGDVEDWDDFEDFDEFDEKEYEGE